MENILLKFFKQFGDLKCGASNDHMCCGIPSGAADILDALGPVDALGSAGLGHSGGSAHSANTALQQQHSSGCGHSSYECVPYYLCKDGVINTDGAGLIDVRISPAVSRRIY